MTGSKLHVRRQQVGIRLRERTTPLPLHMIHSDGHQSRIPTAARDDGHGISNNAVSPSPHANQSKDVSFLMLSIRMPIPDWLTVSPQCIADRLHFTCDEYGFLRTRFDERIRRFSLLPLASRLVVVTQGRERQIGDIEAETRCWCSTVGIFFTGIREQIHGRRRCRGFSMVIGLRRCKRCRGPSCGRRGSLCRGRSSGRRGFERGRRRE